MSIKGPLGNTIGNYMDRYIMWNPQSLGPKAYVEVYALRGTLLGSLY